MWKCGNESLIFGKSVLMWKCENVEM